MKFTSVPWILCSLLFAVARPVEADVPSDFNPSVKTARTLTFEQRVEYQRAIEEVYWRHRIWPEANRNPKPALEQVMSEAVLRGKVEEYLRKSNTLALYGQPLQAEQLQKEMERMALQSQKPEWLAELWAALGNDPYVIAECLVRPLLADARLRKWNREQRSNRVSAGAFETRPPTAYSLPAIAFGPSSCTDDTWSSMTPFRGRRNHTAVWTGAEMIVWGGINESMVYTNNGDRYDPATNSWSVVTLLNAPRARYLHTALWTGLEMIVWGGIGNSPYNTGGRYSPLADAWVQTDVGGAPSPRGDHVAVWTGTEMIVWGGGTGGPTGYVNSGGRYDPLTDNWLPTTVDGSPNGAGYATAVWTGTEMIVWGGYNGGYQNTGGRYDPVLDGWTPTSLTDAPRGVLGHTAVWTGSEMIIWGGAFSLTESVNTGGRYNPDLDAWAPTSTVNAPSPRALHTAIWTGSEMIIWGGEGTRVPYLNTGGRYHPDTDSWQNTMPDGAASARESHTAIWTGAEMLVWGGEDHCDNDCYPIGTGGRYCVNPGT